MASTGKGSHGTTENSEWSHGTSENGEWSQRTRENGKWSQGTTENGDWNHGTTENGEKLLQAKPKANMRTRRNQEGGALNYNHVSVYGGITASSVAGDDETNLYKKVFLFVFNSVFSCVFTSK